jgi:hypothetical protein
MHSRFSKFVNLPEQLSMFRGFADKQNEDMLKVTGDRRIATLDMHGDTNRKCAVERIYSTRNDTIDTWSALLVFSDVSTSNSDRFNVYDKIWTKLIERGTPERQISFIHNADSDSAKSVLLDSVNAGRVRVLLGSTENMEADQRAEAAQGIASP